MVLRRQLRHDDGIEIVWGEYRTTSVEKTLLEFPLVASQRDTIIDNVIFNLSYGQQVRPICRNYLRINDMLNCFSKYVVVAALGITPLITSVAATNSLFNEIPDLGLSAPTTAVNVSKDARYRVYRWETSGVMTYQLNAANGNVLFVLTVNEDGVGAVLPIGSESARTAIGGTTESGIFPSHNSSAERQKAGTAGQCPCSHVVVYDGPDGSIAVVTDSLGNIIGTFFIPKRAKT